jgi:uncharacterized protein (TIGR03492 family)
MRGTDIDGDLGALLDERLTIHLVTGSLGAVVEASDFVLGQGGTANLQSLGLGKPVVSFLVEDARSARRRRIAALTGDSRILTEPYPEALAADITAMLTQDEDRHRRGAIGKDRMGPPGAIPAIIAELTK